MWSDGSVLPLDSELWGERSQGHLDMYDIRDCVAAYRQNGMHALFDTGCTWPSNMKTFFCQLPLTEIKGTGRLCYKYFNSAESYLLLS